MSITLVIDLEGIKSIKRFLKQLCPTEKSSVLTEAIARGLQYKTHASLLAEIKKEGHLKCDSSADAFSSYCRANSANTASSFFLLSLAKVAIQRVLSSFHMIGGDGYGYGQPKRMGDRWETNKEHYDRFHEGRRNLDSTPIAKEFLRSLCFMDQIPQIKTINTKISSYGLKHIAEKMPCTFADGEVWGPEYVGNAALIIAALHLGLKFRSYRDDRGYDSPNVNFNLSHKAIVDIDCIVRPGGARAQDRQSKIEQRGDPIAKLIARQIREQRKLGNPNFL